MSRTLALPYAVPMYARDHALIATPIGPIRVKGGIEALIHIDIGVKGNQQRGELPVVCNAIERLDSCFACDLKDFDMALLQIVSTRGQLPRTALFPAIVSRGRGNAGSQIVGRSPHDQAMAAQS